MRLATFNLESLDGDDKGLAPFDERAAALRPVLARLRADVICLQEVNGQRTGSSGSRSLAALDWLLASTPYADFHRAATLDEAGGAAPVHNLVVLSRFPIEGVEQIRNTLIEPPSYRRMTALPPDEQPVPIDFERPLLIARLALAPGRTLHVVNAHLRAPLAAPIPGQKSAPFVWKTSGAWAEGFFVATVKRVAQALELRLAVERIFDVEPDALIAVAGDLNAQDHETALKVIVAAEDDTGSGRLAARVLTPVERSVPADRRYTVIHHGRPQMLDHILVSRSLLAGLKSVEVHNEALGDELIGYHGVDRSPDSFHAPLIAEFNETALPGSE